MLSPSIGEASAGGQHELFENNLRPGAIDEFIGQETVKSSLKVAIKAAQKREEHIDHTLFHGPPGLGKTTLANIVAKEMGVSMKTTSGPALEKQGDLAAIITNLKDKDVLFIDEIHRLKPPVEEILYSAMEDFAIDIILGKGPAARSMRLPLPKFTLIGATTKLSSLSSPLRDRFGNLFKLHHYEPSEMQLIVKRAAGLLDFEIKNDAAQLVADSSRFTPRIANRLLKRIRDFSAVHYPEKIVDLDMTRSALSELGVDGLGLEQMDRIILNMIIEKFGGGPVGLNTIAAAVAEEENTIEEVYEPYLIRLGFLERTKRGRIVTRKAFDHLGVEYSVD